MFKMAEKNNNILKVDYSLITSFDKDYLDNLESSVEGTLEFQGNCISSGFNFDESEQLKYYFIMKGYNVKVDLHPSMEDIYFLKFRRNN